MNVRCQHHASAPLLLPHIGQEIGCTPQSVWPLLRRQISLTPARNWTTNPQLSACRLVITGAALPIVWDTPYLISQTFRDITVSLSSYYKVFITRSDILNVLVELLYFHAKIGSLYRIYIPRCPCVYVRILLLLNVGNKNCEFGVAFNDVRPKLCEYRSNTLTGLKDRHKSITLYSHNPLTL